MENEEDINNLEDFDDDDDEEFEQMDVKMVVQDLQYRPLEGIVPSSISCGSIEHIAICTEGLELYLYDEKNEKWILESKDTYHVGIGDDGDLWKITADRKIARKVTKTVRKRKRNLTKEERRAMRKKDMKRRMKDLPQPEDDNYETITVSRWQIMPMPPVSIPESERMTALHKNRILRPERAEYIYVSSRNAVIWVSLKYGTVYKLIMDPDTIPNEELEKKKLLRKRKREAKRKGLKLEDLPPYEEDEKINPFTVWEKLPDLNLAVASKEEMGCFRVCITSDDDIWAIDRSKERMLWRYPKGLGEWSSVGINDIMSITATSNRRVFLTNKDGELWKYAMRGNAFNPINGFTQRGDRPRLMQASIGDDGTLLVLSEDWDVFIDIPDDVRVRQKKAHQRRLRVEQNEQSLAFLYSRPGQADNNTSPLPGIQNDTKARSRKRRGSLAEFPSDSEEDLLYDESMDLLQKGTILGKLLGLDLDPQETEEKLNLLLNSHRIPGCKCWRCGRTPNDNEKNAVHGPSLQSSIKVAEHKSKYRDLQSVPIEDRTQDITAKKPKAPKPIGKLPDFELEDPETKTLIEVLKHLVDKNEAFRRYGWHFVSALAFATTCGAGVIASQNWDTCSTLPSPMAIIACFSFIMTMFIQALRDRSDDEGPMSIFWYIEVSVVASISLTCLVYCFILMDGISSQWSDDCSDAWLLFCAFITVLCAFPIAAWYFAMSITIFVYKMQNLSPDMSSSWRWEQYSQHQDGAVHHLAATNLWERKVWFYKRFRELEDKCTNVTPEVAATFLVSTKRAMLREEAQKIFNYHAEQDWEIPQDEIGGKIRQGGRQGGHGELYVDWTKFLEQHFSEDFAPPQEWGRVCQILEENHSANEVDLEEFTERLLIVYKWDIEREVQQFFSYPAYEESEDLKATDLDAIMGKESKEDDIEGRALTWKEMFRTIRPPGAKAFVNTISSRLANYQIPFVFFPASFHHQHSPTLLFAHGLRSDLGDCLPWLANVRDFLRHYNVASFEYPGYGQVKQSAKTYASCIIALDAAMVALNTIYQIPTSRIVLMGFDVGAGAAANYAAWMSHVQIRLGALVLMNPKCSDRTSVIGLERHWDVPVNYDDCSDISCPVFLGHARFNERIPIDHAEDIAAELRERTGYQTRFAKFDGGHVLKYIYYYPELIDFLQTDLRKYSEPKDVDFSPDITPPLTPRGAKGTTPGFFDYILSKGRDTYENWLLEDGKSDEEDDAMDGIFTDDDDQELSQLFTRHLESKHINNPALADRNLAHMSQPPSYRDHIIQEVKGLHAHPEAALNIGALASRRRHDRRPEQGRDSSQNEEQYEREVLIGKSFEDEGLTIDQDIDAGESGLQPGLENGRKNKKKHRKKSKKRKK